MFFFLQLVFAGDPAEGGVHSHKGNTMQQFKVCCTFPKTSFTSVESFPNECRLWKDIMQLVLYADSASCIFSQIESENKSVVDVGFALTRLRKTN